MLAYLVMHMQVGMRTQTRTEIAIQSKFEEVPASSQFGNLKFPAKVKSNWIWNGAGPIQNINIYWILNT